MKYILKYLLIAPVLIACSAQNETEQNLELIEEYTFPVFINKEQIRNDSINIVWIDHGNHNPLYFGKKKDSIMVERALGRLVLPPLPPGSTDPLPEIEKGKYDDYFLDWEDLRSYTYFDSVKLDIRIDTSQIIANKNRKAYPVIIENLHADTIYIGYGRYIPLITEALNKKGEWKPIEERYIYMCGNGVSPIILPPNEIVVTSELVYSGRFKTKLRIKLGQNYSEEFSGSINLTQFESEWDSSGNRKPVPNSTYTSVQDHSSHNQSFSLK